MSESKVIKKLESLIDEKIKEESVSKISSKLFFNYSRMVVKERAIPEVADGLKVVHRRIIFVMSKLATHDFKKSARIVGETMGKFHPHGDLSIYQSLIRLARPFSIRYPLIIGQGNFGSLDGDNPAAMRYTEARLSKISTNFFLSFLHSGCADFISNYDNNEFEPYQIPTLFPFLLVNGASGIGVGVRSFLPSHNLGEIVQTLIHVLDNPAATLDEILGKKFFGPDLPLRGKILFENLESLKKIYSEGRGILNVLAPINIEKKKSEKRFRTSLIITDFPHPLDKANVLIKLASLVKSDSRFSPISSIHDETSSEGVRVVIELRPRTPSKMMRGFLYRFAGLKRSLAVDFVALVEKKLRRLSFLDLIKIYLDSSLRIIKRHAQHLLKEKEVACEILHGIVVASANITEVTKIIKRAKTKREATKTLQQLFSLSFRQADTILAFRLSNLLKVEVEETIRKLQKIEKEIKELTILFKEERSQKLLLKKNLLELAKGFADPRRTEIIFSDQADILGLKDSIWKEDFFLQILSGNLLRKVVQKEIKIIEQHRGGLGTMITKTNEKNRVLSTIKCDSNDRILFITEKGFGIVIAATDIPLLGKSSKKPFVISNLLLPQNSQGDFSKVAVVTTISNELIDSLQLVVITEKGTITKIEIRKIIKKRARLAKRIMRVDEDDKVVGTTFISGKGFLLITGDRGHVLSFPVSLIPVRSGLVSKGVKTMFFASKKTPRRSTKVTGIFFLPEDLVFNQESQVLITSERGMAKLLRINSLKFVERRRGVGSKLSFSRTTDKIASVVGLANLGQVIIFTKNGRVLKTDSKTIRKLISRTAKGVRCIRMVENDQVISVLPVTRSGKNEKISEE